MEEIVLIDYVDGDSFYEITCDQYGSLYDEVDERETLHVVQTSFSYSLEFYGWGAGAFTSIYTYDIKRWYDQLCLLKEGRIHELDAAFRMPSCDSDYIRITIVRREDNGYDAQFSIRDDLETAEFGKCLSEKELDEMIGHAKHCANRFPVRTEESY